MASDINVPSLNATAPVSRKENVTATRELQALKADRARSAETPSRPAEDEKQPDRAELEQSVDDMNSLVQELQRELQFSVDDGSGEMIVKVVDRETDEVLRQIPAEEVLRLRQRLQEATGLLFEGRA
jgi:flagellar protein FlaG